MTSLLLLLICVALSAGLTGVVLRAAIRMNMMDSPNARSSHVRATPRGGGLALVGSFYVALLLAVVAGKVSSSMASLFLPGIPIAVIGWLDDRSGVSRFVRLAFHLGCALIGVLLLDHLSATSRAVWLLAVQVIALSASINFYNFMDGIDGLAGGEAVSIAGFGALLLALSGGDAGTGLQLIAMLLAAAAIGFLVWNWPPARIFMGDVGSGFLGYTFGILAVAAAGLSKTPVIAWTVLAGVFVFDASVTLLRRITHGERWIDAHRSHAYQRAARLVQSHRAVTIAAIAFNLGLGALAVVIVTRPRLTAAATAAALVLLGTAYWWVERRSPMFDRASA